MTVSVRSIMEIGAVGDVVAINVVGIEDVVVRGVESAAVVEAGEEMVVLAADGAMGSLAVVRVVHEAVVDRKVDPRLKAHRSFLSSSLGLLLTLSDAATYTPGFGRIFLFSCRFACH
jgi:hypothetical protein